MLTQKSHDHTSRYQYRVMLLVEKLKSQVIKKVVQIKVVIRFPCLLDNGIAKYYAYGVNNNDQGR